MADNEPSLTFDERLNRIAWVLQEQSSLINSQIQLSHEHEARFAKVEAAIAAMVEQSAKHDAARADHEGRIGRLEAAMARLAEQSDRLAAVVIETERRWLAYLNTLPKH
jgi:hypothetical protein